MANIFSNWFSSPQDLKNDSFYYTSVGSTNAGVMITKDDAMRLSAVLSAVNLISNVIAGLPVDIQRKGKYGWNNDESHQLHFLLNNEPNVLQTAFIFKKTLAFHMLLEGNAYAKILRGANGVDIKGFKILMPNEVEVIKQGDNIYYKHRPIDGKMETISSTDVLHFHTNSADGITGVPLAKFGSDTLSLGLNAERFGINFFENGTNFGGLVEVPGGLPDQKIADIKASLDHYTSTGNSNKVGILPHGAVYKKIVTNPTDSQFLDTRKYQIKEVARLFNIPPYKLGDSDATSYSSNEQDELRFHADCIVPYLKQMFQEIERKCLRTKERAKVRIRFNTDDRLRTDLQTLASVAVSLVGSGIWTAAEGRELFNKNPFTPEEEKAVEKYLDNTINYKGKDESKKEKENE